MNPSPGKTAFTSYIHDKYVILFHMNHPTNQKGKMGKTLCIY